MKRLHTVIQKYAWGRQGSDSKVAQLKTVESAGFEADQEQPYAELWMGTHPNGPSRVMRDSISVGLDDPSTQQLQGWEIKSDIRRFVALWTRRARPILVVDRVKMTSEGCRWCIVARDFSCYVHLCSNRNNECSIYHNLLRLRETLNGVVTHVVGVLSVAP